MIKPLAALATVASAVFLFSSMSLAQAPVASREAIPAQLPSVSTELVLELQSLREEISSLRGIIEELEYQVNRLEKKQSENYEDLDSRVANLYSGAVIVSPAPSIPAANTESTALKPTESSVLNGSPDSGLESRRIYDQGFSALRQGNRESAIQAFDSLIQQYPESREAPDARYWLGETYWLANKKEESRQSFIQLLERTPDYRKSGDAMYRLGVIYDQLGDFDKAFDYMSQVLLSGSSQATAAQAWINEHPPKESSETDTASSVN